MMRTADPLARQVLAFCGQWDMLPRGGLVLCAVSGGRDSMALLHLLSALAEEGGFRVAAAHFHHGLRAAADRDEDFVRDWCREREIPLACGAGNVREFAAREGLSIEDAARRLRYAFLETAARDMSAARTATAHHREDNAETVLLHLLRGTGLRGLGGIRPVRGSIIRPLLETGRGEIDRYVDRNGIPYVEDESNRDTRFTRNRLRLEVLPLLEDMAPGAAGRIAAAASLLREEEDCLRREMERLLPAPEGDGCILPVPLLNRQDPAIRRRLVRAMGEKLGVELTRTQAEAVLALKSGGYLDLPEGLCAVRKPHQLILKKLPSPLPPLALHAGGQDWGPWHVTLERRTAPVEGTADCVVLRDTGGELAAAAWNGEGRLTVENGSRTIKRLFADAGVPVEERADHPAVLLNGKAVAVLKVATDWRLRPADGQACMVVAFRRRDKEGAG